MKIVNLFAMLFFTITKHPAANSQQKKGICHMEKINHLIR